MTRDIARAPEAGPSLEDIRGRCFMARDGSGCWHFRLANGKAIPDDSKGPRMWLLGSSRTVRPYVWNLAHPQPKGSIYNPRWVYVAACGQHDCVNPDHLRRRGRADNCRLQHRDRELTPLQVEMLRRGQDKNRRLTPELRQWLLESTQNSAEAAHGLGIGQSRAHTIRKENAERVMARAAASVFVAAAIREAHEQRLERLNDDRRALAAAMRRAKTRQADDAMSEVAA